MNILRSQTSKVVYLCGVAVVAKLHVLLPELWIMLGHALAVPVQVRELLKESAV